MPSGEEYFRICRIIKENRLHTVCQEANCPNIGECFGMGRATFMILGDTCTRNCRYCDVKHGKPKGLDAEEPKRVAKAVGLMGLRYVVITSVSRDDLEDGGASIFAETIREIRGETPDCSIEVLIPDFGGRRRSLKTVLKEKPDVLNHNIETVRRLFPKVRPGGKYDRSIRILREAKKEVTTKSGFMVGMGETWEEIIETMRDLRGVADILTIGQYLQPSEKHLPVERYYHPSEFEKMKEIGYGMNFKHIESGPLVRSSYHAGDYGVVKEAKGHGV